MPSFINTNLLSLNSQMQLNKSQTAMQSAMQRLSSGLRINSAKDDAAGLGIVDRMQAQVNGLNQAAQNANNGISLAQTAEGSLGEMTTNLQRLRQLAVQSSNATNSASDRAALQKEAGQLVKAIDNVSKQTQFNGINLLDGSFKSQVFQVGANAGQTMSVDISKMAIDSLGAAQTAGDSASGGKVGTDLAANGISMGDLVINGVSIRGSVAADDTASTASQANSAIAKVAAINASSTDTHVTATVNANVAAGSSQKNPPAAAVNGTITINGVTTANIAIGTGDAAINRKAVIEGINAISGQTGVKAKDSGRAETGVNLVAADGRNIAVSFTALDGGNTGVVDTFTAGAYTGTGGTYVGGYTLQSTNSQDIVLKQGTNTGNILNSGLAEGTFKPGDASVTNQERYSAAALVGTSNATGFNFTGAGNQDTFTVSLAGGKSATVVLSTNDATGAALAADIASSVNTALGGNYLTAQAVKSTANTNSTFLQLMSSERLTFSGYAGADGTINSTVASALLIGSLGGPASLRDGDLTINNVAVQSAKASDDTLSDVTAASSNKAASGIAVAAAINALSDKTGVSASVQATTVVGTSGASGTANAGVTGGVFINGQTFSMTLTGNAATDRTLAVNNFNTLKDQTGVVAEDTGAGIKLTAADGRNISLAIDNNALYNTTVSGNGGLGKASAFTGALIGLTSSVANDGIVEADLTGAQNGTANTVTAMNVTTAASKTMMAKYAETTTSKVSLHSAGQFTVAAGTNGATELNNMGFQAGTYGGSENGQFLKDIDISTVEGANKALSAIDNALKSVDDSRADLGAIQNRFTTTISSLQTASLNLTTSQSRIQDADFAAETANLSRSQILQQAGTAMLAQANQSNQGVLSLLR